MIYRSLNDFQGIVAGLHNLGSMLDALGESDRSLPLLEEGLALARAQESLRDIALFLGTLAVYYLRAGKYEEARPLFEESLVIYQKLGDQYSVLLTLNNLSALMDRMGDIPAARHYLDDALSLAQTYDAPHMLPYLLMSQCGLALQDGDLTEVQTALRQVLAHLTQENDLELMSIFLVTCAALVLASDNPVQAAILLGAAEALQTLHTIVPSQGNRAEQAKYTAETEAALGEAAFNAAWHEGYAMTVEQVLQLLPSWI